MKRQYFLIFAIYGCMQPYLPVFLASRGLNNAEIGQVLSFTGFAVLLTPVVITFLADAHLESRTLLMIGSLSAGIMLGALLLAPTYWPIFVAYALYALSYMPMQPLLDGMNFSYQNTLPADRRVPYPRIRLWGTIGFIVPSLILYVWLARSGSISAVLVIAMLVCALALVNSLSLPRIRPRRIAESDGIGVNQNDLEVIANNAAHDQENGKVRLPTLAAFRVMTGRHMIAFLLAMWLCQFAGGAYYAFYPLYLTRVVHIQPQWVGLIANIGVLFEVFIMLAMGWMVARLGMRRMFILGTVAVIFRYALLFIFPNIPVAVATQFFHGLWVACLLVAPIMFLDQHAQAGYRNSMQGVYTMIILGTGRIAGSVLGGLVAQQALVHVFGYDALACVLALIILIAAFFPNRTVIEQK